MSDKFELRNVEGEVVWTGNDRKSIRALDLPEGDYTLWKFQGSVPVRVVPTRTRVAFDSANKKGPRAPKTAGPAGEAIGGESVTGDAIA